MKLKIGIFDSGIGGFTILNSLLKQRKDVEVFYLADTKRLPFGNKNFNEIRSIAKEISKKVLTFCAVAPAYDLSLSREDFFTTFILLLQN